MSIRRRLVPALCLATSLASLAAHAGPPDSPPAADLAAPPMEPSLHDGGFGPIGHLLHQLDLTADQKAQVAAIFAGEKAQFDRLRASARATRQALATTAPTDPGYPALVQTAQTDASAHIALSTQVWSQIYQTVLTKAQQQQIPGLVAAAQAAHQARMDAWKAQGGAMPGASPPAE